MLELPEKFLARMSKMPDFGEFLKSYDCPAERAIRVNTLKITTEEFKKLSPFALTPIAWEPCGFYVEADGLGKTPIHAAGLYYVQEPSAMSAAPELEVKRGERVLDLCSAPGGKGTQLAQYMDGEGIIFLNEINFQRAKILSSNVERLGIKNAVVTCASPERLAGIGQYFDKILVDAPCSGEGMFKKEKNAIPEWSEQNVSACAVRQSAILDCAARMLKGGGRMVYSTCTFSEREDEEQVESFLNRHTNFKLLKMQKLLPHKIRGEGHFFAVFEKSGGGEDKISELKPEVKDKKLISLYREWEKENLSIKYDRLHLSGDTLYSLPEGMPKIGVQTLRCGVRLGEFSGGRFEPSHSLAMCLKKSEANFIDLDERGAIDFLKGLTFACDTNLKGWNVASYQGYPLGWCKAVCGTAKNHLPKGLRI